MKLLHLLSAAVVFSLLQQQSGAGRVCCPGLSFCFSDDHPFEGFPLPMCAEDQGIVMKVYTRNNSKEGQLITRNSVPSVFNGNLLSMFIVHGFGNNENSTLWHSMKGAALQQGDYNVIIVGWSIGAGTRNGTRPNASDYSQSAANIRAVGAEIALVSNLTIQTRGSSRSRQYCVGHSLGSHVCGHAGHYGQFGRVTGLDPAGPVFDDRPSSAGLDQTTADLVDVIHTNGGSYPQHIGTLRPLGHIDFYPNGGKDQPGCSLSAPCSHMRVCGLFIESILTDCFVSRDICTDWKDIPCSCTPNATVLQSLGFHANTYPGRGIFYLETNSSSPFCRSFDAPLMQRCHGQNLNHSLVCIVGSWALWAFLSLLVN